MQHNKEFIEAQARIFKALGHPSRLLMVDALRDGDATTHAQAGVDHVERCGIAERVAPDVTAEDGLAFAHGAFDGIEARAMRATRA